MSDSDNIHFSDRADSVGQNWQNINYQVFELTDLSGEVV